eukprot:6554639-Alexandrium_andersonii.AAC.1
MQSTPEVLHTIVKSVCLLWACGPERWLAPFELLLAQGFPSYAIMPFHSLTSFSVKRATARKRRAIGSQSGNSMNLQ